MKAQLIRTRPASVRQSGMGTVLAACTFAAALMPVAGVRAQMPAALDEAPDDAHLILLIPSLSNLSDKIAILNTQLDLQVPEMANALENFKRETGMIEGIDDNGSLLLIVPDLAGPIAEDREPKFAVLVPVSDYDAFVGNFGGDAGQGVTALNMPDGQTVHCKRMGKYAVMSRDQEMVSWYESAKPAAKIERKVGKAAVTNLGRCDAAIYIDMEAIAPVVKQKLDSFVGEIDDEMDAQVASGMMDEATADMSAGMMKLYISVAKGLFDGSRAVVITGDITQAGIGLSHTLEMKPDSTMAGLFPGKGGVAADMLTRLPDQPYILATAMDYAGINVNEMINKAMDAMPNMGGNIFAQMYEKALPVVEQTEASAAVMYPPDMAAMMAGSLLNVVTIYKATDGQKLIDANKTYITSLNNLAANNAAGGGEQMSVSSSYTDNAMQIEGVQIDQYSYALTMPPAMMQQMGPAAMFGATGASGYVARKDNMVVLTTSLDAQMITKGIKTLGAGNGLGSAGAIANMRAAAVPPNAFLEFYLSPAGIATMASNFGIQVPQLPADIAPLVHGLARQDNALVGRTYVTFDTVRAVKVAVEDFQAAMMQNQGAPGGPGGPGGPPPFN